MVNDFNKIVEMFDNNIQPRVTNEGQIVCSLPNKYPDNWKLYYGCVVYHDNKERLYNICQVNDNGCISIFDEKALIVYLDKTLSDKYLDIKEKVLGAGIKSYILDNVTGEELAALNEPPMSKERF